MCKHYGNWYACGFARHIREILKLAKEKAKESILPDETTKIVNDRIRKLEEYIRNKCEETGEESYCEHHDDICCPKFPHCQRLDIIWNQSPDKWIEFCLMNCSTFRAIFVLSSCREEDENDCIKPEPSCPFFLREIDTDIARLSISEP